MTLIDVPLQRRQVPRAAQYVRKTFYCIILTLLPDDRRGFAAAAAAAPRPLGQGMASLASAAFERPHTALFDLTLEHRLLGRYRYKHPLARRSTVARVLHAPVNVGIATGTKLTM